MSSLFSVVKQDRFAILTFQSEPVNALSADLREAIFDGIAQVQADDAIFGVVLKGGGKVFCAGADIAEFQASDDGPFVRGSRDPSEVFDLIENLGKPVVAAMHGVALGGGLELALACHSRVATAETKLGLPEITLGILPGAGGTQRLPRLVGLKPAAEMVLSGQSISAPAALELGLIDAVASADELVHVAVQQLSKLLESGTVEAALARSRELNASDLEDDFFESLSVDVAKKRPYAFAGARIVECLQAAVSLPFEAALRFEREKFLSCNSSQAAAALQHGFFAQREATKVPGISSAVRQRDVQNVAIIGGGTMGRGIAMAFANAGYPVSLIETDVEKAAGAKAAIRGEYERLSKSGRITAAEAEKRSGLVVETTDDQPIRTSDLVIEAVFENLQVKRDLCSRLGRLCKPDAIIASNTSTLDIDLLADASGRASDFLGLHFFSPANVMRLLEIVRGDKTDPGVLLTALAIARRIQKHAVVSGVCYGFIGNRMLEPYLRETEALLLEGASPAQIDSALEKFGMAMGPCRVLDLAGIDVAANIVREREKSGFLPDDLQYRIVCRALQDLGMLGQKSGSGFYKYEGRKAIDDGDSIKAIRSLAELHGIAFRPRIDDEEIVERCLLPLVNEGFKIVEEGISYRRSDVDVVWLSGYGFPAERGGPLFYAEQVGLKQVKARLEHYAASRGNDFGYWTPAASLSESPLQ